MTSACCRYIRLACQPAGLGKANAQPTLAGNRHTAAHSHRRRRSTCRGGGPRGIAALEGQGCSWPGNGEGRGPQPRPATDSVHRRCGELAAVVFCGRKEVQITVHVRQRRRQKKVFSKRVGERSNGRLRWRVGSSNRKRSRKHTCTKIGSECQKKTQAGHACWQTAVAGLGY